MVVSVVLVVMDLVVEEEVVFSKLYGMVSVYGGGGDSDGSSGGGDDCIVGGWVTEVVKYVLGVKVIVVVVVVEAIVSFLRRPVAGCLWQVTSLSLSHPYLVQHFY